MSSRTTTFLRKRLLVISCCIIAVGTFGVMISTGVFAQGWQDPQSQYPSQDFDPNVDEPLYAGSSPSYGGKGQYRFAPLTVGQNTAVDSQTLYVSGQSLVTGEVNVGAGDFSTIDAAVTAFSGVGHGIFGASSLPDDGSNVGVGVYGRATVNGGTAIWGRSADVTDAIGVYGISDGDNSKAIFGLHTDSSGYAGYFTGKVRTVDVTGGPDGTLTSEGPAVFSADVSVPGIGKQISAGSLLLTGTLFEPRTVNTRTVQDMASGTVPFVQTGLRTLKLDSATAPCKVGGVACPGTGRISAGSTAEWNLGPVATGGTGLFSDKRKVVISYLVEYSLDEGWSWYSFAPANGANRKYEECNSSGQLPLAKFSVTNSLGVLANFRLIVWYKDYPVSKICNPNERWRQVIVTNDVDQNDTIRVYLDNTTDPTAGEIVNTTAEDDIRLFYTDTTLEIDADITQYVNADTSPGNEVLELWFKAQEIAVGPDNTNYVMYYGGSGYPTLPKRDKNNVYLLWDDFAGGTLDGSKWSTADTIKPGGTSSVTQNNELQINQITGGAYTGAGAATANAYPNTGKYTILYDLNPEASDATANDGLYLRNPAAARDTIYYYGPTESALYVGHGQSCSSGGIWVYNYFNRTADDINPANGVPDENEFRCAWASPLVTFRIGAYNKTYSEGSWYGFKVRYDADYSNGTSDLQETKHGYTEVFEPASTMRVWGGFQKASYYAMGANFVLEFHDGYFGPAGGVERIDNFFMRRGKLDYDPPTTLGPEQF